MSGTPGIIILGFPSIASKNTKHSVTFEFQINLKKLIPSNIGTSRYLKKTPKRYLIEILNKLNFCILSDDSP